MPELKSFSDSCKIKYRFITEEALSFVFDSPDKVTPYRLLKWLSDKFSIKKSQANSIIQYLIQQEELIYTYQYGCTFLVRSYAKPVRISSRIILTPPNRHIKPESHEIVIKLQAGASFGSGDHPTTRLSVNGIEQAMSQMDADRLSKSTCLDIGTGSGVLVLTAIRLGINTGWGIDIDPNAVYEAKHNISLNHLSHRITIVDTPVDRITGSFSIITVNLRYPALIRFFPDISRLLDNKGLVVMSGFKNNELAVILDTYTAVFQLLWTNEEKGWGGVLLRK